MEEMEKENILLKEECEEYRDELNTEKLIRQSYEREK